MLIGPSGSGKSTYATKLCSETDNTVVLSSDSIRKELFGDENYQSDNQKVFLTMTRRARELLNAGTNVIWDATSMSRKRRIGILQQLPCNTAKHAIVISATIDDLMKRDSERERTVGKDVIMKQLMSFQAPWFTEGFEDIWVIGDAGYSQYELIKAMRSCLHENPHHGNGPVWNHCKAMTRAYVHDAVSDKNHSYGLGDKIMMDACVFHDCGKPFVKTYDENGTARYYGHDGVGAYLYTTVLRGQSFISSNDNERLKIAVLIGEHMNMHQKDFNIEKLEKRIGKELTDLCRRLKYYDETYP